VWDIVRAVVAQGTTVLLTTQYLDEADQLASRIAVIDRGKVIAEGTKGELKASVGAGTVHLRVRDASRRAAAEDVLRVTLGAEVQRDPDPVALTARLTGARGDSAADQAARALAELSRSGITVDNFALGQPSLDEVFLALTGHHAPDDGPGPHGTGPDGAGPGGTPGVHDPKDEVAA
jgi:ABC-2 type transport system ATP-binding protein